MTPSLSFAVLAFAAAALVLFSPAIAAPANCSYAAIKCMQNNACNQSFHQYNAACASAYASGLSSNCTSQCNTSLAEAIRLEPALSDCECTDYTCSIGQRNLVKACYGKPPFLKRYLYGSKFLRGEKGPHPVQKCAFSRL